MKMKDYAVTLNFYGREIMYVTAPDESEAEQLALEVAEAMDFNKLTIEFEVDSSEIDSDEP
jgi:hypothetical protein